MKSASKKKGKEVEKERTNAKGKKKKNHRIICQEYFKGSKKWDFSCIYLIDYHCFICKKETHSNRKAWALGGIWYAIQRI